MKRYIRSAVVDISDESEHNRWAIAQESNVRPETLREIANKLSNMSPWGAWLAVIGNPNTPADVLETLAKRSKGDSQVFMAIADSPNVTPEILKWMYDQGPTSGPLACIARNPKTPVAILRELSRTTDYHILANCAANPNTPNREKLQLNLHCNADYMARRALATYSADPELLNALAADHNYQVRDAVAHNLNTSVETLWRLSDDRNDRVRCEVTLHPNATPELLTKLSGDSCPDVRAHVAWQRKTPIEILEKLAEDPDETVSQDAQDSLRDYHSGY